MQRSVCPVLVGREAELTLLEDALLSANRGEGRIVLLAGEAGLGKTRLAAELRRRAHRIGMTVLWGGFRGRAGTALSTVSRGDRELPGHVRSPADSRTAW